MLRLTGPTLPSWTLIKRYWRVLRNWETIELEWRKMQQGEHDAAFKLGVTGISNIETSKLDLAYKEGVVHGARWFIERFS